MPNFFGRPAAAGGAAPSAPRAPPPPAVSEETLHRAMAVSQAQREQQEKSIAYQEKLIATYTAQAKERMLKKDKVGAWRARGCAPRVRVGVISGRGWLRVVLARAVAGLGSCVSPGAYPPPPSPPGAMQCLKRRQLAEKARATAMKMLNNVETMADGINMAQQQAANFGAIKVVHGALKQAASAIDQNEVEEVYDDIEENMSDLNNIQDIMGRELPNGVDQSVLEGELAELMDEGIEEPAAAAPVAAAAAPAAAAYAPVDLPAVPTGLPQQRRAAPAAVAAGGGLSEVDPLAALAADF